MSMSIGNSLLPARSSRILSRARVRAKTWQAPAPSLAHGLLTHAHGCHAAAARGFLSGARRGGRHLRRRAGEAGNDARGATRMGEEGRGGPPYFRSRSGRREASGIGIQPSARNTHALQDLPARCERTDVDADRPTNTTDGCRTR